MPSITYHNHHIVPKHDGGIYHPAGSDDPSNLVMLTRPKHTEAHRLLKEQTGCLKCKYAWLLMSRMTDEADVVRRELARIAASTANMGNKYCIGRKYSSETHAKMSRSQMGNKNALGCERSLETRAKISNAGIGRKVSSETCCKLSLAGQGRQHSPETRQRMSIAAKTRWASKRLLTGAF